MPLTQSSIFITSIAIGGVARSRHKFLGFFVGKYHSSIILDIPPSLEKIGYAIALTT